ncbi:MAG: oxygen-independent coproporphyrinogen III oxidase [Parachlamydiales bacterium]|nr:oxygen-independent coproporphyrinogen III oxidase [Parachlamydiales bacterium]
MTTTHPEVQQEWLAQELIKYNRPVPRYTSYPTANEFVPLIEQDYLDALEQWDISEEPLSLYIHIPFCKTMCLFCGCSVILNRDAVNERRYVDYLIQEMELLSNRLKRPHVVKQLHFGGGTPTKLEEAELTRVFDSLKRFFTIDFENGEISIEIDPRTVYSDEGKKLKFLRNLGFNRVSFGVQDTSDVVQEAIKRRQSYEMTAKTFYLAQELGFTGINIDLIYGLPFQTVETFEQTIKDILKLSPDRIALFSYAKIPWLKAHQKAIKDETLPSTEEKFSIYLLARKHFIESGYEAIGMDHFAKKNDELTKAYENQELQRNFQGYSLKLAEVMLSLGVTSIGYVKSHYIQNLKDLPSYYAQIDQKKLPILRGIKLTNEDQLRKWVIDTLMCNFELNKNAFLEKFKESFDVHFKECKEALQQLILEGLITETAEGIYPTSLGRLLIRNVASVFDAYLMKSKEKSVFSKAI